MKKIFIFTILVLVSIMVLENVKPVNTSEISADIVSSASYNTNNFYYNDSTLYQDDKYASYYFNNLTDNFGNNIKGSCTYIAFAMLLSYYDTYWDDTIIPESYDMITMLSNNQLTLDVESPGIYTENSSLVWSSMSTANYYQVVEQYSNAHFHLKLIQMGKEKFGHYRFDNPSSPCGLTFSQLSELMSYYLYDYMDFDISKISYTSTQTNVRQFVIDNIQDGKPVLVRMGSTSVSGIGHAFILYDYDETNDELYGHWGWKLGGYKFEHIKLSTTPYDDFWDATVLNVSDEHNCSNNFKYSDEYDYLETYCPCVHNMHARHYHTSDSWTYYNNSLHRGTCSCGELIEKAHVINASQVVNFRTICLECHALLDLRDDSFIGQMGIGKESANGSYILPNGVIVLVEEDIDAYFAGTLIFYDGDSDLLTQ